MHLTMSAQGMPFMRNYSSDEYNAHNRNFDIVTGDDGNIFVANFEGLLYYDQAEWNIIHTPGITRITTVFKDSTGKIWTGGYNYVGYLDSTNEGKLFLHDISRKVRGEVSYFIEKNHKVYFCMDDGALFAIEGTSIKLESRNAKMKENKPVFLGNSITAQINNGNGITISRANGEHICDITEENGLCSNNVNSIAFDGEGKLWGATDNGIFTIALPSFYTRFAASEGLRGEVLSLERIGKTIYAGTLSGIYYNDGTGSFRSITKASHACWQLVHDGSSLLAATSDGVYRIEAGTAQKLSGTSATAVLPNGNGFYSGEFDAIYYNEPPIRYKVCNIEKATRIIRERNNDIWVLNLYGQVWCKKSSQKNFVAIKKSKNADAISTLVPYSEGLKVITTDDEITFPQYSYLDNQGYTWITDNELYNLRATSKGKTKLNLTKFVMPFRKYAVRTLLRQGAVMWLGGDFGVFCINSEYEERAMQKQPRLLLRSVKLNGDSIIWEQFANRPEALPKFSSNDHNISITYSTDNPSLITNTLYRYRINGERWSAWSDECVTSFPNISHGTYLFEVQAMDAFGRLTNTESIRFTVAWPLYLKWYVVMIYILVFLFIVNRLAKMRTRRLVKEKHRLEDIVQERTAEIVRQKDEIQEQSDKLQVALDELKSTQEQLIQQEKMVTAGKLTQGLIDRILNPMNYINNFSKLSCGLINDLRANIEEEKKNMDEDNYEDTMDVLGMLTQNLEKVEQHGINTTRTLKAMEEILRDRSGGMARMDICALIRQNHDMMLNYYKDDIAKYYIKTPLECPTQQIYINGNAEQLSKTIMSIINNSIYSLTKKGSRQTEKGYVPEISIALSSTEDKVSLTLRDNGIGIEDSIKEKIFDPFFTTKTTGEASGVGLYLSHEIIHNHGGRISVESVKDDYATVTITLPIIKNNNVG
jgi:signal transduction histidine kinase